MRRYLAVAAIATLMVVLGLVSCSDQPSVVAPQKADQQSVDNQKINQPSLAKKGGSKDKLLSDNCPPDYTEHIIQRWVPTGRYQAIPGKFLGISASVPIATRAYFYNEKGFSYVFGNADDLPQLNIPASALVAGLSPGILDLQAYVTTQANAGINKFNIDEAIPGHHGYDRPWVIYASDVVQQHGGTLFFSDYDHDVCDVVHRHDPTGWSIETAINGSPAIRGGTHSKWEYWGGFVYTDPRDQWTRMHNALAGSGRFTHSWIQVANYTDGSESPSSPQDIGLQFGHANNLGSVNTIFTWAMVNGQFFESRLNNWLDVAVQNGWVKREEMLVDEIWCCPPGVLLPSVSECNLVATTDTGQRRWWP